MSKVSHAHLPGVLRKPGGKSTRQKTGTLTAAGYRLDNADFVQAEKMKKPKK